MDREELRRKFIQDDEAIRKSLEEMVNVAFEYCAVDPHGGVHLKQRDLGGKTVVKLVLAAKAIANQLDESISAEATVAELSKATGLAENAARARASEAVAERFAESNARGSYRANPFHVAQFLTALGKGGKK
jgi:hypothetical protein